MNQPVDHADREQHFRLLSKAFFAVSVAAFLILGVSLAKDIQPQAVSLHALTSTTKSTLIPSVARTTARVPATHAAAEDYAQPATEGPADFIEVPQPLHQPSGSGSWATGAGLLGALTLVSGLVFLQRQQRATAQSRSFDPIALGPSPQFSMAVAAGEDSGLLNRPTLKPELADPSLKRPTMKTNEAAAPAQFVTLEYQRKQAKALFDYFEGQEQEALRKDARKLGWTPSNEISNGRWVMFGWLVGMMTEYATGVSFVEQIKITLNNLAILDID